MNWSEALLYLFTGIAVLAFIVIIVALMGLLGSEFRTRDVIKTLIITIPIGLISWAIAGGLGVLA